jgi:hypothetical protein
LPVSGTDKFIARAHGCIFPWYCASCKVPTEENSESNSPAKHRDTHRHRHGHGHGHGHGGDVRGSLLSIFRSHSHDGADAVDSALEASADGVRAVKISLVRCSAPGCCRPSSSQ